MGTNKEINGDFYDNFGNYFNMVAFWPLLPNLLQKYVTESQIFEIGSGPGALPAWLSSQGYEVTCVEPAQKLAKRAMEIGLTSILGQFKSLRQTFSMIAL